MQKAQLQLKTVQLSISVGQQLLSQQQHLQLHHRTINGFTPSPKKSLHTMRPSSASFRLNYKDQGKAKGTKRKFALKQSKAIEKFQQSEKQGILVGELLLTQRKMNTISRLRTE